MSNSPIDLIQHNIALLESYATLIHFLESVYGEHSKIALYQVDESTQSGSVYASNTPEFKKGTPLGEIGKNVLANSQTGYHYLINISDEFAEGDCQRKICYFLIKNAQNQVIGLLIIFVNIDALLKIKAMIDQILGFKSIHNRPKECHDFYVELEAEESSINTYVQIVIDSVVGTYQIPVERMTMEEKAQIIKKLDDLEVFDVRHSVKLTAKKLGISIPTTYRLLKQCRM